MSTQELESNNTPTLTPAPTLPDVTFEETPYLQVDEDDTTNYKYTEIDTLDEDKPIPGQLFYIASFVSPEGVMNCKVRGLKIRGVYGTMSEAQHKIEELKQKDKYFDMYIGEVGKWNPWNADASQVESVKYRNKKLDKIMAETQKTRQSKDTLTLNELVGRTKKNVDDSKKAHKKRVSDSIKNTAKNNPSREESGPTPTSSSTSARPNDSRSRLKRLIEERNNEKAKAQTSTQPSSQQTLENKQELLKQESQRVHDAEQAQKTLSASSDQMKRKLEQVKEMYNKSKSNSKTVVNTK